MANPYIPGWEHIPDGEPRVFGDRVYVYGSHDRVDSDRFCDYVLKVWSAPVNDLNNWICHGVAFSTRTVKGHKADVDWSELELYAPDVVEKDGKYYLYAYILDSKGCVAVSNRPEGPFKLISQYKYNIENHYDNGTFIDPGVLVDDDGRVYIYCGFQGSYMAEINPDNMYEIIDGTYKEDIIPIKQPHAFFEACSPRKVGDTYYLIYSPQRGCRLAYATSKSPTGPFIYRGYIVDNGVDFPGGNNHGSICCINGQWYIFYHRMTNGSIMSRVGCVEKIEILPDGTIPTVEMTSLGFSESLNPFDITFAHTACVLTGGAMITQKNAFERTITNIKGGTVMGWKYFDFVFGSKSQLTLNIKIKGAGCHGTIHVLMDDKNGEEIGVAEFGESDGIVEVKIKNISGRHSIYFKVESGYTGWASEMFKDRNLFELEQFVFIK